MVDKKNKISLERGVFGTDWFIRVIEKEISGHFVDELCNLSNGKEALSCCRAIFIKTVQEHTSLSEPKIARKTGIGGDAVKRSLALFKNMSENKPKYPYYLKFYFDLSAKIETNNFDLLEHQD